MRLLYSPHLLSLLGLCLVAFLVVTFGDLIGLHSRQSRILIAASLVAFWALAALYGLIKRVRSGITFERLFKSQFDRAVIAATPDQRSEVALLRKQLLEAIATIKRSQLGRTRGKAALYEIPWYMVIGHPAAGKSSLIQHSGLSFPITESGNGAVRGVGGTRNCDWFFSTEGILLDTAGRYTTQKEDRAEWLELLKLLKVHRAKTPINGILVTISLPELVQYRSEGFSEYARQIRARIGEIDRVFERKVPIYILVTKLDLLGGFRQFFDHLPEDKRNQVWGATFNVDEQGGGIRETISREFNLLVDGLLEAGSSALTGGLQNKENPALFAFPIEFRSIKNALDRFVELLFEDDPYHTKPLIRGIYFTSALQDGLPRIPAGDRVSRRFELARTGFPQEPLRDSHPFFVRNLFREVIFPDQHLIAHQMRTMLSKARWASAIAGIIALTLSVSAWSLSYIGNYRLANGSLRELQLFDTSDLIDRLTRIGFVQSRIDQLSQYSENTPLRLDLGLFKGDKISAHLEKIYSEEISIQILGPLQSNLEGMLKDFASHSYSTPTESTQHANQISEFYILLKTYLMLGDKQRAEPEFLAEQLRRYLPPLLGKSLPNASSDELTTFVERIAAFYTTNLAQPYVPAISVDPSLILHARTTLSTAMHQLPAHERRFHEMIETANRKYPALGVYELLGGRDHDLIVGENKVPGAYTRAAWDGYIKAAIDTASHGSLQESDWVIATNNVKQDLDTEEIEKNRQYLLNSYRGQYAHAWQQFLNGLSATRFQGIDDAISKLDRLSDFKQSPVSRILSNIGYQTAWDNPKLLEEAVRTESIDLKSAIVSRLLPRPGNAQKYSSEQSTLGELELQFNLMPQLTNEHESASLVSYCAALTKVKLRLESIKSSGDTGKSARSLLSATNNSQSELAEGVLLIDSTMLAGADPALKGSLKKLLVQPFAYSYATVLPIAGADINQRWQRQIYPGWRALSEKYPFSKSDGDATIDEINAFLGDESGKLDSFIEGELQGLLAVNRDRLTPRQWAGMSLPFQRDFLSQLKQTIELRDSVLRLSGPGSFEIQPVPSPGLSEVTLEIDGQSHRYRNGPQLWSTINWPGQGDLQGAKIIVTTFSGRSVTAESHTGRLGWARLAALASRQTLSPSTTQLTWTIPDPDDTNAKPIPIRLNIRPISGTDALALNRLAEMKLPSKVIK